MHNNSVNDVQFDIYQQLGECYAHTGDLEKAKEHFAVARSLKPESELPLIGLGVAVLQTRDFENARRYFQEAIVKNPNSDKAIAGLALVLNGSGRTRESLEHYRAAMDIKPINLTALMGVVQTSYALN
mgnify:CR=1 FL=1